MGHAEDRDGARRRIVAGAIIVVAVCLFAPRPAAAIGDWATNQSPLYLRWGGVRSASLEIDAAFANPAGLVFLASGFHLELGDQLLVTTRVIRDAAGEGRYEGAVRGYVFPTLSAAFAYDRRWALFLHAGPYGGALAADFDDGIDPLTAAIDGFGVRVSPFIAGVTFGAALRVDKRVAVALGGRYFFARSEVAIDGAGSRFESVAEGAGAGLVLSVDVEAAPELLLALQLSWSSPLETRNDTTRREGLISTLGEIYFPDGATRRVTLAPTLALGAGLRPWPRLTLALDAVFYLEGLVDRGDVTDRAKPAYGERVSDHYHTGVELGLGVGYALIPDRLDASVGVMIGVQGQERAIRDALSYYPGYLQIGTGLSVWAASWLRLTAAYMAVFPEQGLESFDGAQSFHDAPVHFAGLSLELFIPVGRPRAP